MFGVRGSTGIVSDIVLRLRQTLSVSFPPMLLCLKP